MYKIKLKPNNSTTVYTLHDTYTNDLILINPKLSLSLNKTGTLTFSVPVTHPYYDKIGKMQCEISVYKNSKLIYTGRPLTSEDDFYKTSSVTCEGILAYLIDSIQRPYSFNGSIKSFLSGVITNHNSQVDAFKQFTLGVCDVADSNNYINRSDSGYTDSLTTVNNKLIDTHGDYISVRYSGSTRYIDYKAQSGKKSTQNIRFGENLLDLNKYIKSENLVTAVIPLGAETEETGINDTKKRVTIESVNNGKDYLVDETTVKQFGYIYKTVEFDDVTLPANLKTKAQTYLNENKNLSLTIELSAVDLSVINVDIEAFNLGDSVRVLSKPHNLDSYFVISEYELDLVDPSNNTITLGKKLSKLSHTVNKNQNNTTLEIIKKTDALNRDIYNAIENATNLITGNNGGYLYINSIHISRKIAEDEDFVEDITTVFSATADELYVNYYKTSSQYSYLRFTNDSTSLYKQFPPTSGTGTDANCGIYLERGVIGVTINDNIIFNITENGATVKGIAVTSDRAKKRNISKNNTDMLSKIKNLNIYNYELLTDEVKRYGFMADELPEEMLAEDKKSVDLYGALTVAIKSIQDLNKKIENLEKEVKELKTNG